MEQQTQPSKRRQLQQQQEVSDQSLQVEEVEGPPAGTWHKKYPDGNGHMVIQDNFTKPVGSYQ